MATGKIRWDRWLRAADAEFHKDEEDEKYCHTKYWDWHKAQEEHPENPPSFQEMCSCEMLSPDQHREGCRLAKTWFEKAQR
jgi:hypothetical protein